MEGHILDDDVDQEEDAPWSNQISGRNCVLFLVDVREKMFSFREEGSFFKQSITCCRDSMLDIAKKQKGDLIGVMLYGTKVSEGRYAPDNVAILQELSVPSVPVIKRFNKMIEDNCKEVREKFGDVPTADLTRAINYGQIAIHLCKKKLHLKNIVMMTYDDNPCGDDERAAFRARKQANELYLHKIEFDVVLLGNELDSSLLFKELILTSKGELLKDWEDKDPIMKIGDVQNQVEKLTHKFTRRLSFLRMGSDKSKLILQVSLFKLYAEPRKFLSTVKQPDSAGETNLNETTTAVNDDDDDDDIFLQEGVLDKIAEDEKQAFDKMQASTSNEKEKHKLPPDEDEDLINELYPMIGETLINITKSELKKRTASSVFKMKRGFHLIGFVQTAEVPVFFNTGEPYFIVPYGRDKNNRIAFSHLLHKCHDRGVSMVGWFCLHKSTSPSLTFLHPLHCSIEDKGHPEGFLLVRAPFSDEFFEVDEAECAIKHLPSGEQRDAAKQIVTKLTLPYVVSMFSNSEYLLRIAMIEALAMDYSDIPSVEDNTDVDLEDVTTLLGDLNTSFTGGNSFEESTVQSQATKRPATNGNYSRNRAKVRKQTDMIEMIRNGQANQLTTAELKDVLKAEGIRSLSTKTKKLLVEIAERKFCSESQTF